MTISRLKIEPSSRAGTYTLDEALDVGLLEDAVAFCSIGNHHSWILIYDDGNVGRATIQCYGFELTTLGLNHRGIHFPTRSKDDVSRPKACIPARPQRWAST